MTVPEDIIGAGNPPEHADDFKQVAYVKMDENTPAIPVYQVTSEMERAAEFRSHQNVNTLNPTDVIPVTTVLPQARRRHRAVITSRPLQAAEAAEYVVLGSREQVDKGQGYRLWNGQSLVVESSPVMYIGPGTNPPTHTVDVSIIDERYE